MSGRRQRDDGWDGRASDAQDSRPGPWLDGGTADRGGRGYPAPSFQPLNSSANGYSEANGYGAADSRGSANGYGSAGNGYDSVGNGYDSSAYGATRNGGGAEYQDSGYGRGDSGYARGGYETTSYGQSGYGTAGYAAQNGGGGSAADYNQSGYGSPFAAEFMSADADDAAYDAPTGTPRPIGRLSIYTLLDDKAAEFDRIAERAAEGVRSSEPDTLVYVIHVVPKAPMQRIIYEVHRDRTAFESHERQPHIQRFMAERGSCVLATNIIDLRLKYAKVAALGGGQADGAASAAAKSPRQATEAQWEPRALASAGGGDQYRSEQYNGSQYGSSQYGSSQYGTGQYASDQPAAATSVQYPAAATSVQYAATAAPAASFTPADDRYAAAASQYATAGTGQYAANGSGQYAANGSDEYAANGSGQYAAVGTGQYAAVGVGQYAASDANGQYGYTGGYEASSGQYSTASAYPATSTYTETGGYSGATGYQSAADYQTGQSAGYPATQSVGDYSAGGGYAGGTTGYSGAAGYQAGDGYPSANGYAGSGGYAGTASSAYFTPAASAASQYPDSGGQLAGGQATGAHAAGDQQMGGARRYRELGAAPAADAASDAGTGEWVPPGYSTQGYR
jgi:quinol monooxygenase YgiN